MSFVEKLTMLSRFNESTKYLVKVWLMKTQNIDDLRISVLTILILKIRLMKDLRQMLIMANSRL